MNSVLTIAGSDPTGGAGVQADLQVFRHLGVHGAAVITALTVQDTAKVHSVLPVFPSVVLEQLRVVLADVRFDAIKIGMLASDDVVRNVALGLATITETVPMVLDPVLFASDGTQLVERRAWPALRELCALVTVLTPNLAEVEHLTGRGARTRDTSEEAARACIEELGPQAVLIKGGHRQGAPDDLLAFRDGGEVRIRWLPGERIEGEPVHGTGCALASAIAAELAKGSDIETAAERARSFVRAAIRDAIRLGSGARVLAYS